MTSAPQPNGQRLIVVSGPSGVGKSTVVRRVLERVPELRFSVSATTREPRPGEREGIDYWFLERGEFRRRIADGRFIEHAEVFGNLYGTPVDELRRARDEGKHLLLEIDVQGGIQVRRKYADALLILLVPPSMETLKARLAGRGTETAEIVERRFAKAANELERARTSGAYNTEVVNDTLELAVDEVEQAIRERIGGTH